MDTIFAIKTNLPTKKFGKIINTDVEGQANLHIEVHQGDTSETKKLGILEVQTLREKVGAELFDLTMEINNDGLLIAELKSQKSNKTDKFEVDLYIY